MAQHNELGNIGEEVAKTYLRKKGYQILASNWRFGHLELDIIAKKDNWLIVIEVKTRSNKEFEHPQEAITFSKIKNIVKAANEYIIQTDWDGNTRFDVVAIIPQGKTFEIEHIEDAFLAPIG